MSGLFQLLANGVGADGKTEEGQTSWYLCQKVRRVVRRAAEFGLFIHFAVELLPNQQIHFVSILVRFNVPKGHFDWKLAENIMNIINNIVMRPNACLVPPEDRG